MEIKFLRRMKRETRRKNKKREFFREKLRVVPIKATMEDGKVRR